MKMNGSACVRFMEVRVAVLILMVLAVTTSLVEQAYALGKEPDDVEGERVNVSCFKGNLDAGNYIGNLTVTSPQNAGRRCNSVYYDCEGECLGCFTDPDRGVQVCFDDEGRQVK